VDSTGKIVPPSNERVNATNCSVLTSADRRADVRRGGRGKRRGSAGGRAFFEAFDIFDHAEWGSPSVFVGCYGGTNNSAGDAGCVQNSTFLRIGSAHPARVLQLGLKLMF